MVRSYKVKRENFDVSPEQESEIDCLQELIKAPTRKDAVLTAVRITLHLAAELRKGNEIFVGSQPGKLSKLLVIGLTDPDTQQWKYLIPIAHSWKKQLFVKGRRLSAYTVWDGILANNLTIEQAADNWDIPIEAITEIVSYCEQNHEFLSMEAAEERRRAEEKGISFEPKIAAG